MAKKVAKKAPPKGELVSEELEFDLTDEEIAKKAEQVVNIDTQLKELKAELKVATSNAKAQIKEVQQDFEDTIESIRTGKEMREVKCTKVVVQDKLSPNNDVTQFWFDGEMKKERPTTDEDRQKSMPFLRKKKVETPFNGMVIDGKAAAANDL